MQFQITHFCFNGSDYVTLDCLMNIMVENGVKMTQKMPQ